MLLLQDWIHKLEEGAGARYLRAGLAVLALAGMAILYDFVALRNFDSEEAMDLAQLARNLSEGRGFTTQFIRPLSLHLVQELDDAGDMRLEERHPDLANAPLYPLLLAGAMKGLPFRYEINQDVRFQHHQPEILITAVNQGLFAVAILLVFLMARGLFDRSVAWMSALVMGGTELFWRFSTAGLPTMLMLDLFLGLVFCLVLLEKGAREETMSRGRLIGLAVAIGVLAALAGLTRYSLAWLILPVVLFVGLFGGRQRLTLGLVLVFAFLIVWMPWLIRNHQLSGHFFGTAGFVVDQETRLFPDHDLERSLNPGEQLAQVDFYDYTRKAMINLGGAVREQVPVLGGSWVGALFLASLLLPFNRPGTSRLRVFILTCLPLLLVVQSLGTTARFETTGGVTSENLLILAAPLVFMYGISFFLVLLEQLRLPFPGLNLMAGGAFVAVVSAPLILELLPPRTQALAYPPYYPPFVQKSAGWMKPEELMMSDIPWAVAWYGDRKCVWLTRDAGDEFLALHDYQEPVRALYLTQETLGMSFLDSMIKDEPEGWGRFALRSLVMRELPRGFPLRQAYEGFFPDQFFLADRVRWPKEEADGVE